MSEETVLRWAVLYTAISFGALALLLTVQTYRRIGRPRWPVHSRWILTALVGAWAGRIIDLALARQFDWGLNPPHTIVWWLSMDVMATWTIVRLATGRLLIADRTHEETT
jgi:hypothetical protein